MKMMKMMKPMKMAKKRYAEGGGVREGRNENIDDETRARARAFIARLGKSEDDSEDGDVKVTPVRAPQAESRPLPKPRPKPAAKPAEKPAPKAERKPVPKTEYAIDDMAYDPSSAVRVGKTAEQRRMEQEQALQRLYPEYTIGGGALKALQKGAQALARRQLNTIPAPTQPRLEGPARRPQLEGPARPPRLGGPSRPLQLEGPAANRREVPEFLKKKDRSPRDIEEARMADEGGPNFKRGGKVKESKAMMGKELAFMKAKGAPKSMVKHEKAEMMGMKKPMKKAMGGTMKYAKGGGIEIKGKTRGRMC